MNKEIAELEKEKQIKEMLFVCPQVVVAYDGNPKGQHLYGEQRQQIAEAYYNAGYRKVGDEYEYVKGYLPYTKKLEAAVRKETAKEILESIFDELMCGDLGEFCGRGWIFDVDEAKAYFEKYGVEIEE